MNCQLNQNSLEDKASAQVAISLCQDNAFKEAALCLEKPTYGDFLAPDDSGLLFETEKLCTWSDMKENEFVLHSFESLILSDKNEIDQWEAAVDEQCHRLIEGMPRLLRRGIRDWIKRIALEYFSYSRRQEAFFGVSRYVLMSYFTREDWKGSGQLDEKKLAEGLIQDEQLTVLKRYRIACAYCLHEAIPLLWKRLSQEEVRLVSKNGVFPVVKEKNRMVLMWSNLMSKQQKEGVKLRWTFAPEEAMYWHYNMHNNGIISKMNGIQMPIIKKV